MEWLRKLLENAKVTDGKIDIDSLMKDINTEFPKNAVPKEQYNQKVSEIKDLNKQISDRDTQLTSLKEEFKDSVGLKDKLTALEADNKKTKEEYEQKIKQINFNHKLNGALEAHKPKNSKALMALLDMEKIKLDGDTITGLEDQIKALKASDGYLFTAEKGGTGAVGGNEGGFDPSKEKTMSVGEKLAKEKAEMAKGSSEIDNFFK